MNLNYSSGKKFKASNSFHHGFTELKKDELKARNFINLLYLAFFIIAELIICSIF